VSQGLVIVSDMTNLERCTETLVLHADGTVECEGEASCGLDELAHDLWVTCDELRCGCVGEDGPLPFPSTKADFMLLAA